jgi:Cu-processing system permease protein
MLILAMVNPIDMARVFLLIKVDMAALMGYTGAVFERFFGGNQGVLVSLAVLLLWTVLPFWAGLRRFVRKDF